MNTRPLLYGLERPPINEMIELVPGYPAKLAELLANDEIDLGLVPVATLPGMQEYHVVGEFCIGAEGEIASVALFSDVPMARIKKVWLDYQSRTSADLLKYLMKEYWGINPELADARDEHFLDEIKGETAGLVIGDRAFRQRRVSNFIYDLGSEWKAITGLPFVFAAWVSKKPLDPGFIELFNEANRMGLAHIDKIVEETQFELFDLKKYYNLHLSYTLDERKRKGMELFLSVVNEMKL